MLKAEGLELNRDYTIIQNGPTGQRLASLKTCSTSATMFLGGDLPRSRELGFLEIAQLSDYIPNLQFHSLIVDSKWAEANSPLTVRYLKAMVRAMQWAHGNREQAAELVSQTHRHSAQVDARDRRRISFPRDHQPGRIGQSRRLSAFDRFDGRQTVQEQALSGAGKISGLELSAASAAGARCYERSMNEVNVRPASVRSRSISPFGMIGPPKLSFRTKREIFPVMGKWTQSRRSIHER